MNTEIFKYNKSFKLESGKQLPELQIGFNTYGTLNKNRDNVVWVCHALTANSDVFDWWKGLFGEHDHFNPAEYFIVCANIIGSAYGSTNPLSINPVTGHPFYLAFPQFTVRDMVKAHQLLADHLQIDHIEILLGGSLGGQQAAEWAISEPDRIKNLILIATNAKHSAWGIAFNESQRLAISADRTFYSNTPDGGKKGLKAARSIALLSYRNYKTYGITQQEEKDSLVDGYKASSYQNYQGEKLVNRFNAYSYWYLSKSMDSHNVGRGRRGVEKALSLIKARTLVIGIKSDVLFPIEEQQYLFRHISKSAFAELDSFYGHDGFLIETEALTNIITSFFKTDVKGKIIELQRTA
ncbi:homoserine O-acetyltransferase family protein [Mucilaginibacter gotjawali]|uniref:Homoserine O-acetyltransferase n=2 Tax=Mucilaginibacter gotjawali TaxID=1550579 RepID=A0A839SL42_9SPHI|nr:homoserine O-acetyltransferase [Mucilaginibacter gotjawali]MBB3058242.1 homoserine O-acetyltransferase [Mucilaginibacter gotjawali]BAU54802.1 Homoserine O-acetyltransferase [Mucilaginibacter gotjawali]